MKKYLVIQLDEGGGDISKFLFKTKEAAQKHLEENEWKAYLIEIDGSYKIEDHT